MELVKSQVYLVTKNMLIKGFQVERHLWKPSLKLILIITQSVFMIRR